MQCTSNWKKIIVIFYIKYLTKKIYFKNFLNHKILIKRHFFIFLLFYFTSNLVNFQLTNLVLFTSPMKHSSFLFQDFYVYRHQQFLLENDSLKRKSSSHAICFILYIMGNTIFFSFHKNMAFWSFKPYSGINIYLISKLWLFGIHFWHKPQCLLLKNYLPENLKCLAFYIRSSKMFVILQKLQNSI